MGRELTHLLRSTCRLTMAAEVAAAILGGVGLFLAAVLVACVIDAALALTTEGLIVVDVLLIAVVGTVVALAAFRWRRNRFNARRVARQVEENLDIRDSRLINAVEMSESRRETASGELVEQALLEGERLAGKLVPSAAVQTRTLRRAAVTAAAALVVMLGSYASAPRLFARVVPRYLDPAGDHPPFTLVDFSVDISPEKIYQGHPATITVMLSGPDLPSAADLVFRDPDGDRRIPMFLAGEHTYVLPIERAEASARFYVDTPKGRSDLFSLPVLAVPLIEQATVEYSFPDYTDWPTTDHPLRTRGMKALVGTTARVTVASNVPLREGRIQLLRPDGETAGQVKLSPSPADPTIVTGEFPIAADGRFRLSLVGANEAPSEDTIEGRITAVPDRPPYVAFLTPQPRVVAVEDWKVPVVIQATDDVEVDRIAMFAAVNGWGASPLDVDFEQPQRTVARGNYEFDLAELGVQAGDIITFYASAYDNRPPDGQFTDTDTYVIQVISNEEYLDYARTKYRMRELTAEIEAFQKRLAELADQREQLADELKRLQEKMADGEELSDEERQLLDELRQQLDSFAEQTGTLAQEMADRASTPQLYEFEAAYQQELRETSERLAQQAANASDAAEQLGAMSSEPGSQQQRDFADAAQQFLQEDRPFDEGSRRSMDETAEDAERVRRADEMLTQTERIQSVIKQQREVADRMAQYRDREELSSDEQRRLRRLAREQDLLRQELEEAARELKQTAEQAQEELPRTASQAIGLCEAIEQLGILEDQAQAAQAARDGAGSAAHASAQRAAENLESLLGQCQGMQGQASQDLDGGLGLSKESMQQALQQLAQGRGLPGLSDQQGQSGGGANGSQAQFVIMGPHTPTGDVSDDASGRLGGRDGRGGRADPTDGSFDIGAETLTPDARDGLRNAAGNLNGVPVGYRDQAEAYFKRLAEDEK